jgi:hypothetical protein
LAWANAVFTPSHIIDTVVFVNTFNDYRCGGSAGMIALKNNVTGFPIIQITPLRSDLASTKNVTRTLTRASSAVNSGKLN